MKILLGDSLIVLKDFPDNSIDSVVTDPPYGLKFMGKKWDYQVPSIEIWKEILRVLKPGGHVLSFGGTRTYHRMVVNIEDAGFEIRDQVMWIYGSGFPKSHNLKDEWQGWGTALKPANEPICLARKPIEKGLTVAENVLKWGAGALNIDEGRVEGKPRTTHAAGNVVTCEAESGHMKGKRPHGPTPAPSGRWPANVLLDEDAAAALDAQSGQLSQCGGPKKTTHDAGMFGIGTPGRIYKEENRGASRFFYVAKASKRERNAGLEGMPKQTLATSTGQTRPGSPARLGADPHAVQEPVANYHPTVKPVKLMEYLCKLICPPGGIILDPFMGSGSTGVAAKNLGFEFIGIEMNEEYVSIAKKRIEND